MQQPTIDKIKLYREFTALIPPVGDCGYTPESLEVEANKVWDKCKVSSLMDRQNYLYNVAVRLSVIKRGFY